MFKRKRTSVVWLHTKEQLQNIINQSATLVDVLRKLQVTNITAGYAALKKRSIEEGINLSKLQGKRKHSNHFIAKPEEVLVENSLFNQSTLRRLLKRENIIPYICECGNDGTWRGKELKLQIDHINGVKNDNRIENLRYICPNCHSQTETFGGKNNL